MQKHDIQFLCDFRHVGFKESYETFSLYTVILSKITKFPNINIDCEAFL